MRIVFEGFSVTQIEQIMEFLRRKYPGVNFSPSDAARWAVSEQATIISETTKEDK